MDFVRSYFGTNEPLCVHSKPAKKWEKKVFNSSEVHLYRDNFLQNPYFRGFQKLHQRQSEKICLLSYMFKVFLLELSYKIALLLYVLCCSVWYKSITLNLILLFNIQYPSLHVISFFNPQLSLLYCYLLALHFS